MVNPVPTTLQKFKIQDLTLVAGRIVASDFFTDAAGLQIIAHLQGTESRSITMLGWLMLRKRHSV